MKTEIIAIFSIVALVIVAGCVSQNQAPAPKNCGTNATCLSNAATNCSAAFGRVINENITMYEEIQGETAAGCRVLFSFEKPALGNATCTVPMNLMSQQASQQEFCQYCTGTFIDLLRSAGGC